jgi:RecB family exonuclease
MATRRRTFSDRDAQLTLPLAAPATHGGGVTMIVEPSAHHVEHALRHGAAEATTLALLESRLVRALLPEVRVADVALARVVLRVATAPILSSDLLDALDSALGALHGGLVDEQLLQRATLSASSAVRTRAELLARGMVAHRDALAALGLVDRRAVPGLLASALGRVDAVELLPAGTTIEVRNFATIPPARLAWLEALHRILLRSGGRVVIHSPTAQGSLLVACGIDDPRERIAARIESRFAEQPSPPDLVHDAPGGDSRLAARLFSSSSDKLDDAPVDVIVASSARAEAEHAASTAADALSRGVAPERIVIALPSADEAIMRPLRRALIARGIPFYEGRGAPPTDTLAVATLLRVLRAIDDRPRKDLLIDILRSVPGTTKRFTRLRAADALACVAASDLRRDGGAMLEAMPDDETRALVAEWLALLIVPEPPPFAVALAHLRAIGDALGFPSALSRYASEVVRSGDRELLSALAHDLSAWSSLAAATDEMARAVDLAGANDAPIAWGDLARELEVALSSRKLVPGHRAGAVSIERLRDRLGLDADVLILLETHDGALPARGAADPLLSRGLLEALREHDPCRAPPPAALAGTVDILSAIDAIGRARHVTVVHRNADDGGRRQLPGALPLELARITHAVPRTVHEAEPIARLADVQVRVEAERVRARAFAAATATASEPSPFMGFITSLEADSAALLANRLGDSPSNALSVSMAEVLLSCPFVVFAERALRAKPKDSVADDGDAREAGELAHRALLEAYRAMSEGETDYAQVVRRTLDEAPASSALQRVRRERLHADLVATIALDLSRAALEKRTFFDGEIAFGDGKRWPALAIEHEGTRVFVHGQIDRIDRIPDGAVVIDYKSRTVHRVTTSDFFDQRTKGATQIALYARAAAQNLAPPVVARFIAYRDRKVPEKWVGFARKDDPSIWSSYVGDAAFGRGLGAVAATLADEVSAMRNGAVPPRRNERCQHCPQRTACRVPPVVLEEQSE